MVEKDCGTATYADTRGPRSYQEDRGVLHPFSVDNTYGYLLAVMDGHNGSATAEFCSCKFVSFFPFDKLDDPEEALRTLVSRLDEKTRTTETGSTISVALVLADRSEVWIAILGDSPVIILDSQGNINVSPEHNVRTNERECEAAVARGGWYDQGYIWNRDGSGLQMSRSFGNCGMGKIISKEPEIYSVEIGPESFILVASDGLLDPNHKEAETVTEEVVRMILDGTDAEGLIDWAEERNISPLADNATAILWRYRD